MAAQAVQKELWQAYKGRGDAAARQELIAEYAPLVKYVAGRLVIGLPSSVELDDLISYGVFGLIDAVEKFDPSRGVKFETYAVSRIKGAILDGLRAWDWVPPSLRRRAKEVERVYGELEQSLGRAATDAETAAAVGMEEKDFLALVAGLSRSNLLSLDGLWRQQEGDEGGRVSNHESVADEAAPDPPTMVEFEERRQSLAAAIRRLPERERLVVALYYYEGLTVREISEVMGVSPSRVSQLHSKAILRLRGHLSRRRAQFM